MYFTMRNLFFILSLAIVLLFLNGINYFNKIEIKNPIYRDENIFKTNTWIVNGIITQYSSLISLTDRKQIEIESLLFIYLNSEIEKELDSRLKCLVKINEDYLLLNSTENYKIPLYANKQGIKFLLRVKCVLNKKEHKYEFEKIQVSVLDQELSDNYQNKLNFILFQKPSFFNRLVPKIKSVANCVHFVYSIDKPKLRKMRDWIRIQRELGQHKIKFYFWLVPQAIKNEVLKGNENFVEIIDFPTNYSQVCAWQIRKVEQYPNSPEYKLILENCKRSIEKFFDVNDIMGQRTLKEVCSNDCLFNFRYLYEYVTNYDFDEFILPRYLNTRHLLSHPMNLTDKCSEINETEGNFTLPDLYSYAKSLQNIYGSNVAYFYFKNVAFFTKHDELIKEILNLNKLNSTKPKLVYKANQLISFSILSEQDANVLRLFEKYQPYVTCLNKTISNNSLLDSKWNNIYATQIDRLGKSIYNTEHTEAYHAHFSHSIKSKTKSVRVPLDRGYCSHFRDSDFIIRNINHNIDKLFFDFEYYNFLYRFSQIYF